MKNSTGTLKPRPSRMQVRSKAKFEFIELLAKACAQFPNLELRIPETLMKISDTNTSYMIFTNEEGYLYCKSHLKSAYEHRFMKRCYYYQRNNCPVTVYKQYSETGEQIKPVMTIKETYSLWKSLKSNICIIQRYIYPPVNAPIKARVEYYVPESQYTKRLTKHPLSLINSIKTQSSEKFLALGDFGEESKNVEENLQVQMQTLKKVIETEDNRNQVISFLVADFVQDYEFNWFFISLISYKFETVLPKIVMHNRKTKVLSKCNRSGVITMKKEKVGLSLNSSVVFKEMLTKEALRDLSADCY